MKYCLNFVLFPLPSIYNRIDEFFFSSFFIITCSFRFQFVNICVAGCLILPNQIYQIVTTQCAGTAYIIWENFRILIQ
jgi:hypothetical protein